MTYNPLYDNDSYDSYYNPLWGIDDKKQDPIKGTFELIEEEKEQQIRALEKKISEQEALHGGKGVPFPHNPGMAVPPYTPGMGSMGPGFIP